jgi:hypothetical protein
MYVFAIVSDDRISESASALKDLNLNELIGESTLYHFDPEYYFRRVPFWTPNPNPRVITFISLHPFLHGLR